MKPPSRPDDARNVGFLIWEIARRAYRWRRLNIGVGRRLRRLQARLANLPRTGVGVLVKDVDPSLDERLAPMREKDRELVIGDFDQDGGILPRFGEIAGAPLIAQTQFMARTGPEVLLVDLDGRLGVRKNFGGRIGPFIQEIEALLALETRGCPVPRLMNVDWVAHTITATFVPGNVVRELLAAAGANIRDRDLRLPFSKYELRERVVTGRQYLPKIMSDEQISAVATALKSIHAAGFVLEDVKFGNIILEGKSGEPVFIDLERALPIDNLPRPLAGYLKQVDLRRFREHFGPVAGESDR
jgi:hypothetical protein